MKKIVLLMLFALLSLLSVKASTVLCQPVDTCDVDWATLDPVYFTFMVAGCLWDATVYVRKDTCNNICNFTVTNIKTLDSACWVNWHGNEKQLIDIASVAAINKIMNDNVMESIYGPGSGCTPDSVGSCITYWKQSKAQCWTWYFDNSYTPGEIRPDYIPYNWYGGLSFCNPTILEHCCEVWYKVCRDLFNQVSVTETQTIPSFIVCPSGCITVCE